MLETLDSARRQVAHTAQFDAVVQLPFGWVGVRTDGAAVREICFLPPQTREQPAATVLAQRVIDQLAAYCEDGSRRIDVPLAIEGTGFQKQVWHEIASIPAGETRSYGEIARRLNSAARAVGQACGDNPLPLAIPCHRVVGVSSLGGFAHRCDDAYLGIKRWLLTHETRGELRLT